MSTKLSRKRSPRKQLPQCRPSKPGPIALTNFLTPQWRPGTLFANIIWNPATLTAHPRPMFTRLLLTDPFARGTWFGETTSDTDVGDGYIIRMNVVTGIPGVDYVIQIHALFPNQTGVRWQNDGRWQIMNGDLYTGRTVIYGTPTNPDEPPITASAARG